jgi:hypothetical protein
MYVCMLNTYLVRLPLVWGLFAKDADSILSDEVLPLETVKSVYLYMFIFLYVCMRAMNMCTYELRRNVGHFFPHNNQLSQSKKESNGIACMYLYSM